mmetsp:Transcript_24223/g.60933  ORF Transcript_24223/g.60933 Transcript_24223/m.60933 type:complete len:204 (-) Transcript_24223:53-664(-)
MPARLVAVIERLVFGCCRRLHVRGVLVRLRAQQLAGLTFIVRRRRLLHYGAYPRRGFRHGVWRAGNGDHHWVALLTHLNVCAAVGAYPLDSLAAGADHMRHPGLGALDYCRRSAVRRRLEPHGIGGYDWLLRGHRRTRELRLRAVGREAAAHPVWLAGCGTEMARELAGGSCSADSHEATGLRPKPFVATRRPHSSLIGRFSV